MLNLPITTDRARKPIIRILGPGPRKGTWSRFGLTVNHYVDIGSVAEMGKAGEDCAGRSGFCVGYEAAISVYIELLWDPGILLEETLAVDLGLFNVCRPEWLFV